MISISNKAQPHVFLKGGFFIPKMFAKQTVYVIISYAPIGTVTFLRRTQAMGESRHWSAIAHPSGRSGVGPRIIARMARESRRKRFKTGVHSNMAPAWILMERWNIKICIFSPRLIMANAPESKYAWNSTSPRLSGLAASWSKWNLPGISHISIGSRVSSNWWKQSLNS